MIDDRRDMEMNLHIALSAQKAYQCKNELQTLSVKMAGIKDTILESEFKHCLTGLKETEKMHANLSHTQSHPANDLHDNTDAISSY